MKLRILSVILVGTIIAIAAAGPADAPRGKDQIASMKWLAGNWEGPMWGGTFRAYYCTPEGGKVMSYNTLLKDGKITYYEFEVFELTDEGGVIFRPFPRGSSNATPLTLTECDAKARQVVFENKTKDYPTRIVYHRVADNRLVIKLSDPYGKTKKTETFDLRRK